MSEKNDVKLELMDYKNAEAITKEQIRSNLLSLKINRSILRLIRRNIARFEAVVKVAGQPAC